MTSSLAVILLNYKRPQNIGAIVDAAREALPEAPIFLRDQADEDDLRLRTDIDWSQVWLQRGENLGGLVRVELAAELPFDFYIAIDDDVFLTPAQLVRLRAALLAEPDRAHGISGQRVEFKEGAFGFRHGITRVDGPLSILNQVYAFSRSQAVAAMALAAQLGFPSWRQTGLIEDVLLSCAAAKPPLCHDLGFIAECPTGAQPGIATWVREGFYDERIAIARKLLAIQAIAVFSPLTVKPDEA